MYPNQCHPSSRENTVFTMKMIRYLYFFDEGWLTFDERLRQNKTNGNFLLLEEWVILNKFDICKVDVVIFLASLQAFLAISTLAADLPLEYCTPGFPKIWLFCSLMTSSFNLRNPKTSTFLKWKKIFQKG